MRSKSEIGPAKIVRRDFNDSKGVAEGFRHGRKCDSGPLVSNLKRHPTVLLLLV